MNVTRARADTAIVRAVIITETRTHHGTPIAGPSYVANALASTWRCWSNRQLRSPMGFVLNVLGWVHQIQSPIGSARHRTIDKAEHWGKLSIVAEERLIAGPCRAALQEGVVQPQRSWPHAIDDRTRGADLVNRRKMTTSLEQRVGGHVGGGVETGSRVDIVRRLMDVFLHESHAGARGEQSRSCEWRSGNAVERHGGSQAHR